MNVFTYKDEALAVLLPDFRLTRDLVHDRQPDLLQQVGNAPGIAWSKYNFQNKV